MVPTRTLLKEMNALTLIEGGVIKDATTAHTLHTCVEATTFRLLKHNSEQFQRAANEIYGSIFMEGLGEATASMNKSHFTSIVRQFCKDSEMTMPKSIALLQYIVEYIVQRAFVRPITQSPKQVNVTNGVQVTNADILHLNEIYGLAGLPMFCNAVTGATPKSTKFVNTTKRKSGDKINDFHRSATKYVTAKTYAHVQ